ncbi:MAG: VOC family protein [Planctomycetes bacterium]|nr:VOC family protein [Planctomycetota bacterium]
MIRFHLSLNVSNLPKAVSFLEQILGVPVAKQRVDYAKFELDSPPLVLSLEPRSPLVHGSLNHLGFRAPDSETLVEMQRRLEAAGIATEREEGVECCYARQTKFWVHDLDHRLWEFYTLDDDGLEHRGAGQSMEDVVGSESAEEQAPPVIWEHRMLTPFVVPSEKCDEVRLRGTFNVPVTATGIRSHLQQAIAVLKPGGKILVHTLTCEESVTGELNLPGPARHVKFVPVRSDLMVAMEEVGFADLQLSTFRSGACFEHHGVPFRETQIIAVRPAETSSQNCTVVFKGPFKSLTDDEGQVWRRGEAITISANRWDSLQSGPMADLFVQLPETATVSHCGM